MSTLIPGPNGAAIPSPRRACFRRACLDHRQRGVVVNRAAAVPAGVVVERAVVDRQGPVVFNGPALIGGSVPRKSVSVQRQRANFTIPPPVPLVAFPLVMVSPSSSTVAPGSNFENARVGVAIDLDPAGQRRGVNGQAVVGQQNFAIGQEDRARRTAKGRIGRSCRERGWQPRRGACRGRNPPRW